MFKVHTIGGYSEVGKNMTAIDFGEDIIVFDCGVYLPAVIDLQETEKQPTPKMLKDVGALPSDSILDNKRDKVRAIIISHAHLDHVGAVQYLAHKYSNAVIIGTPFTIEVLKILTEDSKTHLRNKIITVKPDDFYNIKGKNKTYKVEMINMTHSTLQTAMIALHTPDGIICYADDFKLDNNPTMGKPPSYKKMIELSKKGVKLLIVDALYSGSDTKTPSEKIARALVEEVLLTVNHRNKGIVITTFSSHIARLKSIVEFSRKLNRQIIFVGRSLNKYITAAKKINQCPFEKQVQIASYKNQVSSILKQVNKKREKYVLVCTGHQAEPGSILDRIVKGDLPFKFHPNDSVIFSSKVIPVPINISARAQMDKKIRKQDVRIFDNVHVSGHGGREDIRELVSLLKPKNVIPSHGSLDQLTPAVELFKEMGYNYGKNCHLMQDGGMLVIN